jgi:flagellar protein FliS
MNPYQKPWESYRKVAAQTATPGHLVLMLYEGAIKFLEQSLAGFNYTDPAKRIQTINNNIIRAQAIINELNCNLDMRKGGEVAENFRGLYSYLYRRLREANFSKRRDPIEEVLARVRVLRDSWAEMLRRGVQPANTAAVEAVAA